MTELDRLVLRISDARGRFLDELGDVNPDQATFKADPSTWSLLEITEHMVRAEKVGLHGIWRALEAHQSGESLWQGEPEHRGLSIEEVTDKTWRSKEDAPNVAAPREGGSFAYWRATLRSLQLSVEELARDLSGIELDAVVYPHPISGPLDARQRLEFLRFHLDRHRLQVAELKQHPDFPETKE